MRVGYVLRYWPALTETFVAREIGALRRRGVQVEVVAIGTRADGALAPPSDAPVLKVPRGLGAARLLRGIPDVARPPTRWLLRHLRPKDAARVLWVAAQARRRGWDRIHAHFAGEAAVWARGAAVLSGLPYTVTVHATDLFRPGPWLPEVLQDAQPVVTVCDHHAEWIAEHYGVGARVVRCGVDPASFPSAAPDRPGAGWLSVARDVDKKGLDDLVAAVAGTGVPLRLVSDAHRLSRDGVEVGLVAPEEIPQLLTRAMALVLPCRVAQDGDRDGVPLALMEAMAAGLPVVTTAVAGIPELVDSRVGWIAPHRDPIGLRRVLAEVAADPAERVRRGQAGRERITTDGWTVAEQADGLLSAWRAASVAT